MSLQIKENHTFEHIPYIAQDFTMILRPVMGTSYSSLYLHITLSISNSPRDANDVQLDWLQDNKAAKPVLIRSVNFVADRVQHSVLCYWHKLCVQEY